MKKKLLESAKALMSAAATDVENVRNVSQGLFEVGEDAEAHKLLAWAKKHPNLQDELARQEWFVQLQAWDAAYEGEKLLAAKPVFEADDANTVMDLVAYLRDGSNFSVARRLLARLAAQPEDLLAPPSQIETTLAEERRRALGKGYDTTIQRLALCTYKDPDIHPSRSLNEAERLLVAIGLNSDDCTDAETLGLGGAVFKRKGELTGQLEALLKSLECYRRGWSARNGLNGHIDKNAYCGVNAAFVMDLLASRLEAGDPQASNDYRRRAQELREEIRTALERSADLNDKWVQATLAEALFGLRDYDGARAAYIAASTAMCGVWERRTMFQQAVQLARAQNIPLPDSTADAPGGWPKVWQALWPILKEKTPAALRCYRGKVGLALSGGGFRAAFYHLGVLARLAEIDALRHVEVLSTVSGGSIVGAHYYLKLKALLKEKGDNDLRTDDYVSLVEKLIEEFEAGVSSNLRMRAFGSISALARMFFRDDYNRTVRIGELFAKTFYAKANDTPTPTLRDLIVTPKDASPVFSPRQHNWLRHSKVPILLVNATSLNSGHSWQFAGSFMGEPPGLVEADIDAKGRYARVHLDRPEVSAGIRNFPLGSAVAASAAVPGIFSPLPMPDIYTNQHVQLVDGGVYDNQGIDTLLQENCSLILCSDACGQLNDKASPSTRFTDVLSRSNKITMERGRIVEYQDLRSRLGARALDGLFFVHLRQGLGVKRIAPEWEEKANPQDDNGTTPYGIKKSIQRLLAMIRTDLDSFSEVEARTLMLSGYLASTHQLCDLQSRMPRGETWGGFETGAANRTTWPFLAMLPYVTKPSAPAREAACDDVKRQLGASAHLFGKVLRIGDVGDFFLPVLLTMILASGLWQAAQALVDAIPWSISASIAWLAGVNIVALKTYATWKCRRYTLYQAALRLLENIFAVMAAVVAQISLKLLYNRAYLRRGSLARLQQIDPLAVVSTAAAKGRKT